MPVRLGLCVSGLRKLRKRWSYRAVRSSVVGMFQRESQVFANAEPLDDSYEPEDIRERDEELKKYQRALQPIIDNRPTTNIFLYGKTGTGKTVATKFIGLRGGYPDP